MHRKRDVISIAVIGVIVIAGILAVVLIPTFSNRNETLRIVLPNQGQIGADKVDISRENRSYASKVELTPDNVRQVLATLMTPDEYIKSAAVTFYYGESSSVMSVRSWVSGLNCRCSVSGTAEKEKLLTERSYYCWDKGERRYYAGPRGEKDIEDISLTPDWRELLSADTAQILSAEFANVDQNPVIIMTWRDSETGGEWSFTVSIDVGLLVSASLSEEGKTVYSMETSVLEVTSPPDGTFTLPDGSAPY